MVFRCLLFYRLEWRQEELEKLKEEIGEVSKSQSINA